MAIQTYTIGPGKLLLGPDPEFDVSGQVRNARVEPSESVTTREAIGVLSGEELPKVDSAEYTFVLAGTMLQSLVAAGVIDWSYDHAGEEMPFVFVPNDTALRAVKGVCRITPLTIGGDVPAPSARVTADPPVTDFSWAIIGTPIFGVYDPLDDSVEEDA